MTMTADGPVLTGEDKELLLARVRAHREADRIAQGAYFDASDGRVRVCAVGCAMVDPADPTALAVSDWHAAQEERWGIPAWLGRLEDRIFEGLPEQEARELEAAHRDSSS